MKDIIWDFQTNDTAIVGGDFFIGEDISDQNALLIVLKSAVNILDVSFGVGLEQYYCNEREVNTAQLSQSAQRQVLLDGATQCKIVITNEGNGTYSADVSAKYPA